MSFFVKMRAALHAKHFFLAGFFASFLFAVALMYPSAASAATLYLSPSSGSYAVGATFTVNVMVSSADQSANGYSGTVSYPSDLLELTSLGKGGSVVSLWVQDPSYSAGFANFEGVAFNPGYKGGAGKILSLTFKAKASGVATVRFNSGSILANDGQGTNILTGLGSGKFTIGEGAETPSTPAPTPEVAGKPAAPKISSTTHPDPAAWYSSPTVTVKWGLPAGADGVNILADQQPTTDPGTSSDGVFSSYTYQDVKDGKWFVHVRVRNKNGWSPASHFPVNIDTVPPTAFQIQEMPIDGVTDFSRSFRFESADAGSGITRYEIQLDGESAQQWSDDGSHIYATPPLQPGKHTLAARVFDAAGNSKSASVEFVIQALAAPRIIETPRDARVGEAFVVRGLTYPDAKVTVWMQFEGQEANEQSVMSNGAGAFVFVRDAELQEGMYRVWATVTDDLGNVSVESERLSVRVKAAPLRLGELIANLARHITVGAVSNVLLLGALLFVLWRYKRLSEGVGSGKTGAREALHDVFDAFKDDLKEQISLLERAKTKRELTAEEGRILKKLKKDLSVAEVYLRKKIKSIGK
jgi:hypothetical protein